MADEPDVGVNIGGVYDEGSTQDAAAKFEAAVRQMMETIQGIIQQYGKANATLIFNSEAFKATVGDVKAFEEALKRLGLAAQDSEPAIAGLGKKSAETFEDAEGNVDKFINKVNQMKEIIQGIASATGANFETVGKALSPLMSGTDRPAFTEAIKQLIADEASAATASDEMKNRTVKAFNDIGASALGLREKVDQMKQLLVEFAKSSGLDFGTIQKALMPQISPADRSALTQAIQEIKASMKEAESASGQLKTITVSDFGAMGETVTAYRAKVDQMKEAIQNLAKGTGASLDDIQKALAPKMAVEDRPILSQSIKELKTNLQATGQEKDKFKGNVSALGNVAQQVFGVVFGITVYGVLRKIIDVIKESTAAGEEYLANLFRLSAAVRALQRGGLDISLADVNKTIDELNQKFPQFSKVALTEGMANALLFTANLKLTNSQIKEMITASTTLGAVMGRDVNEVMRTMALTLSSGYSEGLQRLGININKVSITEKARTQGIKEGYNAMTQQQRAVAALAIITEQTLKMQEDAAKFAETTPGKLAKGTADLKQSLADIGTITAPIWSRFVFQVSDIVKTLVSFLDLIKTLIGAIVYLGLTSVTVFASLTGATAEFLKNGGNFVDIFLTKFRAGMRQAKKEVQDVFFAKEGAGLGNVPIGEGGNAEEEEQKILDATAGMQEGLDKIIEDGIRDRLKLETDYARDLEKLDLDLKRDMEDAERDHQRNLAELEIKGIRAREDAARNRDQALVEDAIKAQQDIADAEQKHRDAEVDAEEKYQQKIKNMQQDFLLNLEDAIRARNAKTAFQLLRRFKVDVSQAEGDYNLDKKQRDRDFQRELSQLAQQRQRRAEERQREYLQKVADLARQAEQDRVDEEIRYQRQQADLKTKNEQARADRLTQYQQQLVDLQNSLNDQYKTLANSLVKQYSLTVDMLNRIFQAYLTIYGPNGNMDKLYQYMIKSAEAAAAAMPDLSKITGTGTSGAGTSGGHSEGGVFIAYRPVTATFGERGPEVVSTTPLSYIGKNTGKLTGVYGSGAGQAQNLIHLEVTLSPDLESRVVEASIDQMSDLMVSVGRERS